MYSNYFSEPLKHNMRAYEILPTLKDSQSSLQFIVTESPRSFELCKHSDNDYVQLAIRSTVDDIESYAKSLNIDYKDTEMSILPIISKDGLSKNPLCFFFDFELEYQLNFTSIDAQQEPIINKIIRAMNVKNCAILIQFLFTTSIKWNSVASTTTLNLSHFLQKIDAGKMKHVITGLTRNFAPTISTRRVPDVKGRSSSIYTIGKRIEKSYQQKTASTPISLSIRGMIMGNQNDIRLALQNIEPVFGSVIFSNDFLRYCDYHVDSNLAYEWLVNNEIANKYAIHTLQNNQSMWSNAKWGIGRDFVPFLCLTPDEFSVFVSLPTDLTLPISFRRQKIKSKNYEKMVFPLGTIL